MPDLHLTVVGGGLAGSESAWQAAQRGVAVTLFEMRPGHTTPAHRTGKLAELVCSNSLGSNLPDRALGVLKNELRHLGSLIVAAAEDTAVPAGGALAVGREEFARQVTERIESHPLIQVRRQEIEKIPLEGTVIIATGPLTSEKLASDIADLTGRDSLYFYDAMAPIVTLESVDMSRAFRDWVFDQRTKILEEIRGIPCAEHSAKINALHSKLCNAQLDIAGGDKRIQELEAILKARDVSTAGHTSQSYQRVIELT